MEIWTIVCFSIKASLTDDIKKILQVTLKLIIQFKNFRRTGTACLIYSHDLIKGDMEAVHSSVHTQTQAQSYTSPFLLNLGSFTHLNCGHS